MPETLPVKRERFECANMRRGLVAIATLVLPFIFLATNGFVHNTPMAPTGSRTETRKYYGLSSPAQHQHQQLGGLPIRFLHYRRRQPRNQISEKRNVCNRYLRRHPPTSSSRVSPPRMISISAEDLHVSVVSGAASTTLVVQASYIDPHTKIRRTWTASRSEQDFYDLGVSLMGALGGAGGKLPGPPRMGSSPAVLEGYLRRLMGVPVVTSLPALYVFLDAPQDLTDQEPVLFGEVISSGDDGDNDFLKRRGKRFRSADPSAPRSLRMGQTYGPQDEMDRRTGAAVAGAVGGWIVGGPVGAAIGAVAVRAASRRKDGVGEVAKGAGAVADAALDKAADLERELNITGKAGQAVRGATEVVKKVDSDLKVTERARGAANRALTAAQKADKELRVRERAAGAAKTAEKAAKRAAEAARNVEKEHRLQERAGNTFRQLRSSVQRTVKNLERRKKPEEDRP